ncbi:ABC-type sugar transport system, periplasmic component [Longilinea arvoryzae]|uniref:ABC-type sugar transport system, periplasmic component n=1 Tax=Longilinea arvoryzae TaxID=360412 RepID=A0A0S7B6G3_9CHLR|nr:ABC transporter substrate-binding protein [Longilinea arvoryzae]GAP12494.1 ABC-type sugar transport system, periplasmic component [Longilinea arvoryzae]
MRTTKFFPLLMVIAMLAGVLAACAPAATPTAAPAVPTTAPAATEAPTAAPTTAPAAEPVKLTFWFNWEGTNADVMKDLVNRFNAANPDIVVEPVFQPYADMTTLLQTSIAGGTTPDVVALDLILIPQFVETGAIAPLDDYVAADANININDFYPLLANYDVMGGKRYALPVSTNNMQLIWNKDLFKKAGLDPEKAPATWDEMQAMAKQCQDPANGVVGFEFYTQPTGEGITWQFQVWLWAAGGEFLNADNTAAAFNTPEGLKALTYVSDMLKGNGSQPGPWGLFGDQKACMQLDGSWLFGYRKDAPFQWGIAPVPAPAGGTTASNVGGEHIFMFDASPNKDAAWKFIQYLTSPDVQLEWDQKTGFLPVRQSVAENADYLKWINETEPRMLPFVQGMATAHTRPATSKYYAVSEAFSREIQKALLGEASPADALAAAEKAVNDALK